MSQNRILTVSVLLLLVMTSGALLASGGEEEDRNSSYIVETPVRASSVHGTEYTINPPDIDLIDHMENVSLVDGDRISFDRNVIREFQDIPASPETNGNLQSGKNIAVSGHLSFFSIIRGSSADGWFSFYLLRYDDRYGKVDGPILVSNTSSFSSATSRLHVHEGTLFYLMSLESADPALSRIFVKTVNITEWFNISSVQEIRLDDTGFTSLNAEIASNDDATVVLWTSYGNELDRYTVYEEGVWSSPISIPVQGTIYWPVEVVRSGIRWIYLYHTTGDGRYINMTKTSSGGSSWSPPKNILFTDKGITSASFTWAQGKFHIAVVHKTSREIGYSRSSDGESWAGIRMITGFFHNYRDPVDEAVISGDDGQIMIVYENSTGRISSIVSNDNGNTFSTPFRISTYYSHHPSMDPEKRYYSFINGTDLEIRWFEPSRTGSIRTDCLSPLALGSWDQIGIQHSGFENGGRIDLRVLSGSGGGQIYPGSGYVDALGYPEGTIEGRDYSSVIEFTGDWSTVVNLEESIVIELVLERSGSDLPALNSISVNYSTTFPMIETFAESLHIRSLDNLTHDEDGLTLTNTDTTGHVVIGPIVKDGHWPDVMGVMVDSVSDKISIRAEILRDDGAPYPGFDLSNSRNMNDIDSVNYMKWEDRSFQDLPDTIDGIFIHVTLSSQIPGFKPSITRITLEYSEPPIIKSASVDTAVVTRGDKATISFQLSDREDPVEDLDVVMKARLLGGTEWSDSMISSVIAEDGQLKMNFITNYTTELGEYLFSAYCTDSNGNRTDEVSLDFTVTVLNYRPTPPMIFTDPPELFHGSDLTVGIIQDGTDRETKTKDLTYNVRFIMEGFTFREVLNTTERSVSMGPDILRKGEVWNVEVRTWDGDQESLPSTLPVYVQNSGPEKDEIPENLTLSEDSNETVFDSSSWFKDLDGDFLDYDVSSSTNITAVFEDDKLLIDPAADFNGEEIITVTASDGMENKSQKLLVIVTPVNDPPVIDPITDRTVYERDWLYVDICSRDEADGDHITVSSNIPDLIPGIKNGFNYQESANGSFYLRPDNSMVGDYSILVTAFDGTDFTTVTFNLTIINVNDPPSKPMIMIDESDLVIVGSKLISLKANGSDPDMIWGADELSYEWSSDISGDLGTGEIINVTLPPGEHVITLRIEDSKGLYNETSIMITVVEDSDEPVESFRTANLLIILGIIAFLIGLIVGIVIFVLSRKREKGEDETDEKTEKSDDKPSEDDKADRKIDVNESTDKETVNDKKGDGGGNDDKEGSR